MGFPIGAGWWAIFGALVVGYLLGQFTNLTTPLVRYLLMLCARVSVRWFATRTRASLEKRIRKLENKLAEAERYPPLDPVQNHILWEIKSVKLHVIALSVGVIYMIYLGVRVVANPDTHSFKEFSGVVSLIVVLGVIETLRMRYERDFRWIRQAAYRENLRKAVKDLKELREKWDADMPDTKPK